MILFALQKITGHWEMARGWLGFVPSWVGVGPCRSGNLPHSEMERLQTGGCCTPPSS
jgi:hypothetical protein